MEIHHKVAGVILKNKKMLMCRKYDEPHFIMPGGKILNRETAEQTLKRELKEELNVELISLKYFNTYKAPHFRDKDKIVKMETYLVKIKGKPKPTSEINEIIWIDSSYKDKDIKIASIDEDDLVPELKEKNLIN